MSDDEPITRREFDAGIKRVTDRLDKLNGAVAENTKFRVQSKAVYAALLGGWAILMAPLTVIAIAVLA